jgi:hypothetical protein
MSHCLANHHITGHLVFVFVSTELVMMVMMCPVIDNPTSSEIRPVISFLQAKNMNAVEIHSELCVIYGQNVMRVGTVRQWCRMFKDGRASKCLWSRVKWSAICSEWWSFSKCWPKNLWKTTLHNFRIFTWISKNFTHSSLWDYHS